MYKLPLVLLFIFGLVSRVLCQIDCVTENKISVRDYDGNLVKNASVEMFEIQDNFKKVFAFTPQKVSDGQYVIVSEKAVIHGRDGKPLILPQTFWLKASASNFKNSGQTVKLDLCKTTEITVRLEQVNQLIKLHGTVYDPNGAVVTGVKLRVREKSNVTFGAISNEEGKYQLKLLPGKYDIEFQQAGFEKYTIKNFELVNSTFGEMNIDIVLRPEPPSQ
jgi:hypothetical protein